jgi:hypothetical protein
MKPPSRAMARGPMPNPWTAAVRKSPRTRLPGRRCVLRREMAGHVLRTAAWNGRCYMLLRELVNWPVARQECIDLGGNLATITCADELAAILPLTGQPTSIDGVHSASGWHWDTGEAWAYPNWPNGTEPDAGTSTACLRLDKNGGFELVACGATARALCERGPFAP